MARLHSSLQPVDRAGGGGFLACMQASCFFGNRPLVFFPLYIILNFVTQGRTISFFVCFVLTTFVFFVSSPRPSPLQSHPAHSAVLSKKCCCFKKMFFHHLLVSRLSNRNFWVFCLSFVLFLWSRSFCSVSVYLNAGDCDYDTNIDWSRYLFHRMITSITQ